MTTEDQARVPAGDRVPSSPRRSKRKLVVGTALCSTFLLLQCSKPERDFEAILPGTGGRKGEGGDGPFGGETGAGGRGSGGWGGEQNLGGQSSGGQPAIGGQGSGGDESTGGAPPVCNGTSDPNCECIDGSLFAKDEDEDGEGTRLCEAAPGLDCDDSDPDFVRNACGGCVKDLGGNVGDACGQCGLLECQGTSTLVCRSPSPQPKRCSDINTPQLCVDGSWVTQTDCTGGLPVCLNGSCVQCNPGAPTNPLPGLSARQYKCDTTTYEPDDLVYRCSDGGFWESSWILSCYASSLQACDAATGSCKTVGIPHLRDRDFEVVPALLRDIQEQHMGLPGRPVLDVMDSLLGSKFG